MNYLIIMIIIIILLLLLQLLLLLLIIKITKNTILIVKMKNNNNNYTNIFWGAKSLSLFYQPRFTIKGLVHFQIKITFPYNVLAHVIQDVYVFLSSVEKKWRFLVKIFQDLYHIVSFNGLQMAEGQNDCFSAASKSCNRYQTTNKGLI